MARRQHQNEIGAQPVPPDDSVGELMALRLVITAKLRDVSQPEKVITADVTP